MLLKSNPSHLSTSNIEEWIAQNAIRSMGFALPDSIQWHLLPMIGRYCQVFNLNSTLPHIGYFAHHALGMDSVCLYQQQTAILYRNHQRYTIQSKESITSSEIQGSNVLHLPVLDYYQRHIKENHPAIGGLKGFSIKNIENDPLFSILSPLLFPHCNQDPMDTEIQIQMDDSLEYLSSIRINEVSLSPLEIFFYCARILCKWNSNVIFLDRHWEARWKELGSSQIAHTFIDSKYSLQYWLEKEQGFMGMDKDGRIIIRQGHFNFPDPILVLGYCLLGWNSKPSIQ